MRALTLTPPFLRAGAAIDWRLLTGLSNLCVLLAMLLTVAAFATLAGANWLAQHFVTDRLSFIFQPLAAIAIGLGYFRVRAWVARIIERVLFRERFAAEVYLEAVTRGLPFAERAETIDAVLADDVARALKPASSAVFRPGGGGFARVHAVAWESANCAHIGNDDLLVRTLLADGAIVRLGDLRWTPGGLPAPPRDPALAIGAIRRGALGAIGAEVPTA